MKQFSLPSEVKISEASDFRLVYREGKKIITDYFVWFFLKGDGGDDSNPRLGITVTKSVGKAHCRNRIKRQVREFFRLNKERFPKGSLVIKARVRAARVKNKEIRRDLEEGIVKLGFSTSLED